MNIVGHHYQTAISLDPKRNLRVDSIGLDPKTSINHLQKVVRPPMHRAPTAQLSLETATTYSLIDTQLYLESIGKFHTQNPFTVPESSGTSLNSESMASTTPPLIFLGEKTVPTVGAMTEQVKVNSLATPQLAKKARKRGGEPDQEKEEERDTKRGRV